MQFLWINSKDPELAGLGHTLALLSHFMQVSFSVLSGGLKLA